MMRLLESDASGNFTLTEHADGSIPPYTILSHTWGDEEVTFEDMINGEGRYQLGYQKIWFCAEQTRKDGLRYFWVDTCCINKANPTELSEAINSMFRWYHRAKRCYVYLSDVSSRKRDHHGSTQRVWEPSFRASRWFTRGWTLQELLAPESVEFFSRDGKLLGNKRSLASIIQAITAIPNSALCGTPLSTFETEERFRWAARRNTTKPEDKAYCLLGIFDVYMAPIFGEQGNALVRLKDEIDKKYGSQSVDINTVTDQWGEHRARPTASEPSPSALGSIKPQDRIDELLNFLGFEQIETRLKTIKSAYSNTCAWLLRTQVYMDWLDPDRFEQHDGFLWIKGKPGAGKSTIVKFAHAQASKQPRNREILVAYFFNARGDAIEKSTVGMYRSLLYQLLQQAGDLYLAFDDILEDVFRTSQFTWTIELLRELLTSAVRDLGPRRLKCFIDALDECDEDEIRDMIHHFEELGQISRGHLNVCFASRHYPTIKIRNGIYLILEDESGHDGDLAKYVRNHLRIDKGKVLEEVQEEVRLKANGVFMWAVLVIDILNKEFKRGRMFAVKNRLRDIPEKLSDLFKDILFRDTANMDDLLLCIQWILFSKRPLERREFYFAMVSGLDPEGEIVPWDPERVSYDDISRFVSSSSKGLAELTKSRNSPSVQFIHESVRDFLLKEGGLYELWPELQTKLETSSHHQLSRCCQKYLKADLSAYHTATKVLPKAKTEEAAKIRRALEEKLPFLKYATEHLFYHANEAAKESAEDDPLRDFDLKNWVLASNMTTRHETRRHTEHVPLVYLLAEYNGVQILSKHCRPNTVVPASPYEQCRHPLLVALEMKHWDAVRILLGTYNSPGIDNVMQSLKAQAEISVGKDVSPLHWAIRQNSVPLAEMLIASPQTDINLKDNQRQTPLSLAARGGHEAVVQQLLSKNAIHLGNKTPLYYAALGGNYGAAKLLLDRGADANGRRGLPTSPLYAAIIHGHSDVVELLLDQGADADATYQHQTTFRIALQHGHEKVAKILLDACTESNAQEGRYASIFLKASDDGHQDVENFLLAVGVDVNGQGGGYGNALRAASFSGYRKVVQLLLDAGADVNLQGDNYGSALQTASVTGKQEIVQLLLDAGADVNAQGGNHGSALQAASFSGCRKVVQLLLNAGADVNAQGGYYDSALQAASVYGQKQVVQLLLDAGADVNAQGGYYGSALQAASLSGCRKVVQLLLNAGADVNAQGGYYDSALQAASVRGHKQVVQLLLDAGADVSAQGGYYGSALQAASLSGCREVVQLLLNAGADVNAQGGYYDSALQAALVHGQKQVVQLLLDAGADVSAQGSYYDSALQAASVHGHKRWCSSCSMLAQMSTCRETTTAAHSRLRH